MYTLGPAILFFIEVFFYCVLYSDCTLLEVLLLISCSTCVCISVTPEWVLVGSGVEYAVHSGGSSGGGHTL